MRQISHMSRNNKANLLIEFFLPQIGFFLHWKNCLMDSFSFADDNKYIDQ